MISLHHANMSSCAQKVRFVLEQKGLEWNSIMVDLHGGENLTPEFLKLNPKGVIPVLLDDEDTIIESGNICLYLDEKYPETPLMPTTFKGRSDVRVMLQLIDEHVHSDISACTYTMAFGPRLRAANDTPEKLAAYLASIPDAGKRRFRESIITLGIDCPEFELAVVRTAALLERLDGMLQDSDYLVGSELTIADIAYAPYLSRLEHLKMEILWTDKTAIADWFARIKETVGYQKGLADWFAPEIMENMARTGQEHTGKVAEILASR